MIWYDHASEGVGASEDDVAPFLPIDGKSDPLEHLTNSWPETSVGSFTTAFRF